MWTPELIITKHGSDNFVNGADNFVNGAVDLAAMESVSQQLADASRDRGVVMVASGYRAAAKQTHPEAAGRSPEEQAAIGQEIMDPLWAEMFGRFGVEVDFIEVTDEQMTDRGAGMQTFHRIRETLGRNALAIVNQRPDQSQDGVSGDNDPVAGWLARGLNPELTAFFTGKVRGIQKNPDMPQTLIPRITRGNIADARRAIRLDHASEHGRGPNGKLDTAWDISLYRHSRRVFIGNGRVPGIVSSVINNATREGSWIDAHSD